MNQDNYFKKLSLSSFCDKSQNTNNISLLSDIDLDVKVEFGDTKMSIANILDIRKGQIISLDQMVGDKLKIYVAGKCVAEGEPIVQDEQLGIRVTNIFEREIRKF